MRGLAVVALGAVLIWLGLSGGSGADPANTDPSTIGDVPPAVGDVAPRQLAQAPTPAARQTEMLERPAAAPDERSRLAVLEEQRLEALAAQAAMERQLAAERRAHAEAMARTERERTELQAQADQSQAGAGSFRLGSGGPGTSRVAELLLDAWLAGDPDDLSTYLGEGEGADLPANQRRLIAAFWQAFGAEVKTARQTYEELRGAVGVTSAQLGLLAAAIDPPGRRGVPRAASSGRAEPLDHAMRMVLLGDEAARLLEVREYERAAVAYSDLIKLEVSAPWAPHRRALLAWAGELEQAQMNHRFSGAGNWPSIEVTVGKNETLTAIRKRVMRGRKGFTICTGLIEAANGITGYIHPGDPLRIPTDAANAVVDLDARLIMYRHGDEIVRAWECGIGKENHETPIGEFTIGVKLEKPAHSTAQLPYGHPDNPLGSHWLALERNGRNTSYGIHGTNDPDGVGGKVSLGCIRMRNRDVGELFRILPQGAKVILQR